MNKATIASSSIITVGSELNRALALYQQYGSDDMTAAEETLSSSDIKKLNLGTALVTYLAGDDHHRFDDSLYNVDYSGGLIEDIHKF